MFTYLDLNVSVFKTKNTYVYRLEFKNILLYNFLF